METKKLSFRNSTNISTKVNFLISIKKLLSDAFMKLLHLQLLIFIHFFGMYTSGIHFQIFKTFQNNANFLLREYC